MLTLTATRRFFNVSVSAVRVLTAGVHTKVTLPDLPYDYHALEPVLNADIMHLHHDKHHLAYVTNLNIAIEKLEEAIANNDHTAIVANQSAFKFNYGGHLNHSIYWKNLAPPQQGGGGEPQGELATAIIAQWGSFENFRKIFNTQTAAIQGSGWGWLGYDPSKKQLAITTLPNQEPLQALTGHIPLLAVDVWEHAYYLQYMNARPKYLEHIWKIINWKDVSERYTKAKSA